MLRAAIVGMGWWGQMLVDSVQGRSQKIKFVAGQTRTPSKVEAYARDRSIALKESFDDVIADPGIDAVVLATPHSEHVAQIVKAAQAGKHIYTEKPFSLDLAGADEALAAVDRAGITLGISFQRRFHPSMIELRKRVRDGRLGTIDYCTAEMTTSSALSMPPGYWRTDPSEAPAGAMTGIGVHLVDGMIDLFGEIDEVYCLNARRAAPHADDTTAVMLRHRGGVIGTFTGCFATVPGYRFEVAGSGGTGEITGHFLEKLVITPMPEGKHGTPPTVSETIETPGYNMLGATLEAFADAVGSGQPFPIPPDQIRHGVAVFEAIVRSAGSGQPVKVPG